MKIHNGISMMEKITCNLCGKQIEDYEILLNHLEIDESRGVDICKDCIDKFLKWQQGIYARLFPMSSMKRMLKKLEK